MRKKLIYLVVIILMSFSCKAQKIDQEALYGTFYGLDKGKDFSRSYTLELKEDGSFSISINVQDANPQCDGQWKATNNEVLLQCEAGDNPFEMIASGYMGESKHTLRIINKNKLKYKDTILKRKK